MLKRMEWPTLAILTVTYQIWLFATTYLAEWSVFAAVIISAIAIAQFSSLQHEMLHGHPFRDQRLNAALVFPALTLIVPYLRFRDTHLAHHHDNALTDPFDDPESNYLDGGDWEQFSVIRRGLLTFNNTLAGRLLLGPLIGTFAFIRSDLRNLGQDPKILRGWLWHMPAAALVIVWVHFAAMPLWAYAISCYGALSLLRIRTFLEHQAHERARGRTVVIEDRGPLALLFLNNNFHAVHHMHPRVAWYRLPSLYRQNAERYLRQNGGYRYRSYSEIFRRYLLTRKDPVVHPLWRRG